MSQEQHLTQSQFKEFHNRTMKMENMIKALQNQVKTLQSNQKRNNSSVNQPNTEATEEKNNSNLNNCSNPNDVGYGKNQYGEYEQPDSVFPPWYTPYEFINRDKYDIKVLNSLLPSTKVPFKPKQGRLVKWYSCGPTVYAPSHLGHARTYITFDIIRNILENYFKYTVQLVMNITDVDDKIILRARQNYLFDQYLARNDPTDDKIFQTVILKDFGNALELALEKRKNKVVDAENELKNCKARDKDNLTDQLKQNKIKYSNVETDLNNFNALETDYIKNSNNNGNNNSSVSGLLLRIREEILRIGQSSMAEKLDKEQGSTVTDKSIYEAHSRYFEKEFFEDMRALNIRDPNIITRVTEYVPEIIKFVDKLIENKYAYVSKSGSVYFDVAAYLKTHDYPKLDPKQLDSKTLLLEGEGALSQSEDIQKERKSGRDFALWKASKEGEPFWESEWGKGRPGWHIECSVMANQILGEYMDIHTGGKDLKFPHHDNEMAQTCAFLSDPKNGLYPQQWVNYWFHTGHLDIKGQKMSKSLKNFKTIREGLKTYTCRQIRLMFVGQSWYTTMDFSDTAFAETFAQENKLREFFYKVNALKRIYNSELTISQTNWRPNKLDSKLFDDIANHEVNVDNALRDNFDYPTALRELFMLINSVNKYIDDNNDNNDNKESEKQEGGIKIQLITKAAQFVNDMLKIFGVISNDSVSFLGNEQNRNEEYLRPVLDVITAVREDLVTTYRKKDGLNDYREIIDKYKSKVSGLNELLNENDGNKDDRDEMSIELVQRRQNLLRVLNEFYKEISDINEKILNENNGKYIVNKTDALRDDILPKFGIKIEDQPLGNQLSFWKLHTIKELEEERMRMEKEKNAKKLETIVKRIGHLRKTIEDWEKKARTPEEHLRTLKNDGGKEMYTKFNEKGEATHDADGNEITNKGAKKRAKKFFDNQVKQHKKYLAELKKNSEFLTELRQELGEKEKEKKQLEDEMKKEEQK